MRDLFFDHLEHVLCVLLLISRLGDILSTYLVTPRLELEANPIARRLGWRFIVLSVFICVLPYFHTGMAVMALVAFLFVSSSNIARIWAVRTMGEREYRNHLLRLARKSRSIHAIAGVLVSASFLSLSGGVLCLFYPDPQKEWAFWFGAGIVLYAVVIAFYGSLYYRRLFRSARAASAAAEAIGAPDRAGEQGDARS